MTKYSLFLCVAAVMLALSSQASATNTVAVSANGDLYASGQPDGIACCAGDTTPTNSPTLAPITLVAGDYLTFSTTGSATNQPGPVYATADGNTGSTYNLYADYGTGISGPTDIHLAGLAGVFLGSSTPSGAAPGQLSGTTFASVAPELGQIFFIGDGLTGTGNGSVQTFYVPQGATRLYLGVADNGGYFDNSGNITASITQEAVSSAPEPAAWTLMFAGLALVGWALRTRQRKQPTFA